jgi:hypothetical protein
MLATDYGIARSSRAMKPGAFALLEPGKSGAAF